jgi:hypothetical protein
VEIVKEVTQSVFINSLIKLVSQKNHAKTMKLKMLPTQHAVPLNNARTATHHHHQQANLDKTNVSPLLNGTTGKSANTDQLPVPPT